MTMPWNERPAEFDDQQLAEELERRLAEQDVAPAAQNIPAGHGTTQAAPRKSALKNAPNAASAPDLSSDTGDSPVGLGDPDGLGERGEISPHPDEKERAALRRTLLRRLNMDDFSGWLALFLLCVLADTILWVRSIPLLVESAMLGGGEIFLHICYGLTRLWLIYAAWRLIRRRSDADRSVRFALTARLGFALLVLILGAIMAQAGGRAPGLVLRLAILSMLHDVAWWLYFRFSRRVRTVLEDRERPQITAVPDADCPPYEENSGMDALPDDNTMDGSTMDTLNADEAPASAAPAATHNAPAYPTVTWAALFAVLFILLWQSWTSVQGIQQLIYLLIELPLESLLRVSWEWSSLLSVFLLILSPLVAIAGYSALLALMLRAPGGQRLALILISGRIVYWIASTCLSIFSGPGMQQPGLSNARTSGWWLSLLLTTLVFDIAFFLYARNAKPIKAAFAAAPKSVPGKRKLAAFCSARVSGPGPISRLTAATARAERTAFTGLRGWLLLYCGLSFYVAVFYLAQSPALSANSLLALVLRPFSGANSIQALFYILSTGFAAFGLLRLAGLLLIARRSPSAATFLRGTLLANALFLLAACVAASLSASGKVIAGTQLDFGPLLCHTLSFALPLAAACYGWTRYFKSSRRVYFTLGE